MKASDPAADARRGSSLAVAWLLVHPVAAYLCFQRVQLRIWNRMTWIDLIAMTAMIAPFLASKWFLPPRSGVTRIAWWLCALMALDVLAFAIGILAPTHGHPSLEAVLSLFIGVGKVALVPAALLCLAFAALRGERATTILLGTMCLIGETLYTLGNPDEPLGWFAWLASARP